MCKIFLFLKILKFCADIVHWTSCNCLTFVVCRLFCETQPGQCLIASVTSAADLHLLVPPEFLAYEPDPFIGWKNTDMSPLLHVWPSNIEGNSKMYPEKSMPGWENWMPKVLSDSCVHWKGDARMGSISPQPSRGITWPGAWKQRKAGVLFVSAKPPAANL